MTLPDDLLTLDDWDALPEDVSRRFELVDGVLHMSPHPTSPHQVAAAILGAQLNAALIPQSYIAVPEVDVVLDDAFPPLVRAPDIAVLSAADARTASKRCRGDQVRVAIEVISPGSARVDRVAKLAEYAEAGIRQYWIVDITEPVTLDAFTLDGPTYRQSVRQAVGAVQLTDPVPLTIDLTALAP